MVKVRGVEYTQLPKYIPPLPNPDIVREVVNSQRGGGSKVQHRIIIGNISKWIPPDTREDNSTHKWMVYIRNQDKDKGVTQLIRKVRYFLHESYKPHDIIDVTSSPFHLTRRGWGEFPIRVQLHFHHPLNKPVDIIHHLKLDMTCSGVQTLGAETVVDLYLHQSSPSDEAQQKTKKVQPEGEYANGKKTVERGDVFDGNLLMLVNGINSERLNNVIYVKKEQEKSPKKKESSSENVLDNERTNPHLITNSSNSMLDTRELQEIIDREHDYVIRTDRSGEVNSLETVGASLLKLINSKSNDNSVYKNGTVFDSVKNASLRNTNLNRTEILLSKDETEIFRNLKSLVNKLEGEAQSKYCMKMFRHSYLVNTLQRVHATKLKTVESLIQWFFRRWPIITELALDPTYKHVHPYSCPSEEEFCQYNVGKQRSAEWFRAKAIQKILVSLKPVIPIEEEIWTTKQILMWSRFHGYSPIQLTQASEESKQPCHGKECNSKRLKGNDSSSDTDSSDYSAKRGKSNDGKFVNGLNATEKKKNFKKSMRKVLADDSAFQAKSYRQVSSLSDVSDVNRYGFLDYRVLHCKSPQELDVVNVEDDADDSVTKNLPSRKESTLTVVTASLGETPMNRFVCGATRQIGIKLSNEEVIPGVMCDSVVRVTSQATISFLDELLRKSLAQAWLRNGDRAPSSLEYDDVLAALMEHPQFDIFTSRGLGTQPAIKSEQ
ncbi:UNVERIFIED_CONTAM: hypothetical protein PYX00_010341 [Menopon gallinae]|uniref:YEATS domain-containing protein n=1 Tax=Menopon gallinae TaxID=328185 RepID=A0AAW2HF18_9NEOP